jgi:nitrogen fixation protein FixH
MNSKITHSGNIIIVGFGMMILFMCFLVYKSINNEAQMVNDNYYENELKFQDRINAKANGDAYTDEMKLVITNEKLQIRIPTELSNKLTNGNITFYCISSKKDDKNLAIKANETGLYAIDVKSWDKLSYIAKLTFECDGKKYYHEMPFNL